MSRDRDCHEFLTSRLCSLSRSAGVSPLREYFSFLFSKTSQGGASGSPRPQASGLPFSTKSSPWGRDGKPGEASPVYPTLFASLFIWHETRYVYMKFYASACGIGKREDSATES